MLQTGSDRPNLVLGCFGGTLLCLNCGYGHARLVESNCQGGVLLSVTIVRSMESVSVTMNLRMGCESGR